MAVSSARSMQEEEVAEKDSLEALSTVLKEVSLTSRAFNILLRANCTHKKRVADIAADNLPLSTLDLDLATSLDHRS